MTTLHALYQAMCAFAQGQWPAALHGLPQALLKRLTPSFVKDRVQFQRIAAALGASMEELPLSRLDAQAEPTVERYLRAQGLGAANNTRIKVRYLHEVAIALGHVLPDPVVPDKPRRHRLTRVNEAGVRVKRTNSPYPVLTSATAHPSHRSPRGSRHVPSCRRAPAAAAIRPAEACREQHRAGA